MIDPRLFDEWAASRDLLQFLYRLVRREKPQLVVECGSGISTVILAEALRKNGGGRLISLEHDPDYYAKTRQLLVEFDLEADLRLARIVDGWYDPLHVPTEPIDILFIDGPPGGEARYPAFPALQAQSGIVVLDDARRIGEQVNLNRWLRDYPEWKAWRIEHKRGTALLARDRALVEA